MGNYLQAVKSDGNNDNVVTVQKAVNSRRTYQTRQTTRALAAIDSDKDGRAFAVIEQEPTEMSSNVANVDQNAPTAIYTISDLPVELLAFIVHYFDICQWKRLEMVNKQFRAAVLMAWRDLRKLDLPSIFGYDFGGPLPSEGQEALRERKKLKSFLETSVVRSPFIEEYKGLTYYRSQVSSLVLQQISQLKNLKRLHVYRAENPIKDMGWIEWTIDSFFRYMNSHRHLSYHNDQVSEALQATLSQTALNEFIYLSNSVDKGKCLLQMNCDQLTLLDLACSDIDVNVIGQLLFRCTKLIGLNVSATQRKAVPLLENNLFTWLSTAESLTSLKMNFFVETYDPVYSLIWYEELHYSLFDLGSFEVLTELEMMDFCYCIDPMLEMISYRFANSLKILRFDIRDCSENALLNVAERMINLQVLQFWSYLNPKCNDNIGNNVTDNVLLAITTNLTKLHTLDLSCPSASTDALKNLGNLKKLRKIFVINRFNDEALIAVALALGHQLTDLMIPSSDQISEKGMIAAAKHLLTVRNMDLCSTNITDKCLKALVRRCPALERICMTNCDKISVKGLRAVADSCQRFSSSLLWDFDLDIYENNGLIIYYRQQKQTISYKQSLDRFMDQFSDYKNASDSREYWYSNYCSDC